MTQSKTSLLAPRSCCSWGFRCRRSRRFFLKLRQMGLDIPADVHTIPYAVKAIQKALAAKQGGGADA